MLSCHTTHQTNEPPVASMPQARQSKYAHDEYMKNLPVAEEGLSHQQVSMSSIYVPNLCASNSLFSNYVDAKPTRMEERHRIKPWTATGKKYNKMEYKLGSKIISQFEEYAKFKKEKRLERSRVRKVEAENAQIKMEIKVTSVRVLILATYPCFLI